jgi:hypothetical protein
MNRGIIISQTIENPLSSSETNNSLLLQRHRLVNDALSSELQNGVHALSITVSEELISKNYLSNSHKTWPAKVFKSPSFIE